MPVPDPASRGLLVGLLGEGEESPVGSKDQGMGCRAGVGRRKGGRVFFSSLVSEPPPFLQGL